MGMLLMLLLGLSLLSLGKEGMWIFLVLALICVIAKGA